MVLQPSLTFNLNDQCAPSVIQIVNNTDIPQGAVMLVNYGIGNSVILNPGTNFFNYLQAGSYEIEVSLSFNTSLVEVTQPFIVSAAITPQLQWLADQDLVSCLNCEDTGETSWLVDGVAAGTGTSISDNLGIVYSANFTNEFGCIGTAAIVISNVVEIDESQLKLYPNPSSGDFRIESDQPIERLEIVNSLGQKVVEQNGLNITSTIISLPIQGTYMVRALVAGDWVETRVLVVR
jgi:hypothetical protein